MMASQRRTIMGLCVTHLGRIGALAPARGEDQRRFAQQFVCHQNGRAAPAHNESKRPASSPASAFLIHPAASISAALRSSSCAIVALPSSWLGGCGPLNRPQAPRICRKSLRAQPNRPPPSSASPRALPNRRHPLCNPVQAVQPSPETGLGDQCDAGNELKICGNTTASAPYTVSNDGTVWDSGQHVRLIAMGFSSSDETVPVSATEPSCFGWHRAANSVALIGKGFSSSTDETVPVCATHSV
jgi:hypothetical protein